VLALPFARQYLRGGKAVRLKAYYWRRVTRLEPPYILVMLGLFAVHVLMLHTGSFREMLPHLGASLLYIHSIVYGVWSTINPVAWSLETEIQFYLVAPLLSQLFRIPGKAARRGAMISLILGSIALSTLADVRLTELHLERTILVHGKLFLVGFLFADYYLTDMLEQGRSRRLWDVVGVLAILGIFYVPHDGLSIFLFLILLFCLLGAVFNGVTLRAAFGNPWVTTIGGMCYTIYLVHYAFLLFVLFATRRLVFDGPFWLNYLAQAAIGLPLVLGVSAIYFLLIERPCMYPDWPQRLGRWLRGVGARTAPV